MEKIFEYFLNAEHYVMWLWGIQAHNAIDKLVKVLIKALLFLFPRKIRETYYARVEKGQEELENFYNNRENGFHISIANHFFGLFYSNYSTIFSFIFAAISIKILNEFNCIIILISLAIPIGLCYIPAYRAVYSNNKYLIYFKKFEKENQAWHRKWNRLTILFSVGGVFTIILGLAIAWGIWLL